MNGPMIYITLFKDRFLIAPCRGFIDDIMRMYHRKGWKKFAVIFGTILVIFLEILCFILQYQHLDYTLFDHTLLFLWLMFFIVGTIVTRIKDREWKKFAVFGAIFLIFTVIWGFIAPPQHQDYTLFNYFIEYTLFLWLMIVLIFVIISAIIKEVFHTELLEPIEIRMGPCIIPIIMVTVIFSVIGIVFGILILLPLYLLFSITIESITWPIFIFLFWLMIIKTFLDFSLFAPEKHLQRPEEFMKNHEYPSLLYFYKRGEKETKGATTENERDTPVTCKRGQTIFCVSESGSHPHELVNQFVLDGLRNGEYCVYILSARDIGTIIKQLFEQKKEIEDKVLQLDANSDEMKRFRETMKICHHDDHVKRILKEIIMIKLGQLKENKIDDFIDSINNQKIEVDKEFKNALKLEAKHRDAEETLREGDLTKLRDFVLKDLVEEKFKEKATDTGILGIEKEIVKKLKTEFCIIEQDEAEKIANAVISEVKYGVFRNKNKKIITKNVEKIVEQIFLLYINFDEIKKRLNYLGFVLSDDEGKKLTDALNFKSTFEENYCIFKSSRIFEKIKKEIGANKSAAITFKGANKSAAIFKHINDNSNFFESIEEILKLNKGEKEEIRKIIDEQWKDFFKKNLKEIREKYLFSWDDVPGKDNERLLKFLKDNLNIEWAENAKIEKSDDNTAITLTKENKLLTFKINKKEKKVTLEITNGKTYEYILKEENGKIRIYQNNYPYYYEQYRELSRLRWFFSNIGDYTENDKLVFMDAFTEYRGMREKERQNLYIEEKKLVFKAWWNSYLLKSSKNKILVRKYEITPGSISSLHRNIRELKNRIYSIPTKSGVYVEEFCNHRIAFNMFSDFFEVADVNQLFQLVEHSKETSETNSGAVEFIAIKPEEFEKLETLYKDMDKLATVVGDIYIRLEDSGKKDPRAKVRIMKHHDRNEETKDNIYYDLCEKHGWLYLEGCGCEEKEISINGILKKISPNGRRKLADDIKDMVESEKRKTTGEGKDKDKEATEGIKEILEKEGISRTASEILLRAIAKEPEKVLYEIGEIEKLHIGEAHEEYLKEYEEHSKEHGEILDIAFWVALAAGTYMFIQECIHVL